eukprot:TRINITY_DN6436_c0_g1_i4.p1 TRINITY_DN6436_c0_g1~~TRINITY_DN6436_c0_g1_i4.p1  ORF type:complete len:551 (+),score=141.94 TRINITY_DN6436_c0_g1_i4:2-1654(+)
MGMDAIKSETLKKIKVPETYSKVRLLGTGTFGKAYLVESDRTGDLFVAKEINVGQMSEEEKKEIFQEAKILEGLNHPNIIRFREVYRTRIGALCIIMEYADGGDLLEKMEAAKGVHFPESQVVTWFTQIALAIKHCHDRKILHRDLKAQNIFLTAKSYVKLGDFGISKILERTYDKAVSLVGTPYYLSPELVQNDPYSFDADIWSLGVLLYEMCCLKPPFDGKSLGDLAMAIVRGKYEPLPACYSVELKELVRELLAVDPKARPTINQILRKEFIHRHIKTFLDQTIYNREFAHTILHGKVFGRDTSSSSPDINIFKTTDNYTCTTKVVKLKKTREIVLLEPDEPAPTNKEEHNNKDQHLELPKLPGQDMERKTRTPIPRRKVSHSPMDRVKELHIVRKCNVSKDKRIPLNVLESVNTQKPSSKRSGRSAAPKPRIINIGIPQKLKVAVIKGVEKGGASRNGRKLEAGSSFRGAARDRSQVRKRRILRVNPVNTSEARQEIGREQEIERQVTHLADCIIESSVTNKKKLEQCDEDIGGMILELKSVLILI